MLLRFRNGPVAAVEDIKSMFLQVLVEPKDCDSLRFLWWPNGDLLVEPEDYPNACASFWGYVIPSCCGFTLRKAALDNRLRVCKEAVDSILRNFYVDDFLKSFDSISEAVTVVKAITKRLFSGMQVFA